MTAFLAEYLRETTVPELELCAVLAWSVTRFQAALDSSSMRLSALQAQQAARAQPAALLHPTEVAVCGMRNHRPATAGFQVQSSVCKLLARGGFCGQAVCQAKAAIHPGSLSRRLLQRSLLYLNSWLATL